MVGEFEENTESLQLPNSDPPSSELRNKVAGSVVVSDRGKAKEAPPQTGRP